MKWFKSLTTVLYVEGVKRGDRPPYQHRFWQRNYYDRVIRDDKELEFVHDYIENNPATWFEDSRFTP
ncbi:MAG TPA: hypothetical protein VFQ54_12685 [Thermomicrobiales bacterium]|nr:hypothetical protein [Thermomicrobiales bacterium]